MCIRRIFSQRYDPARIARDLTRKQPEVSKSESTLGEVPLAVARRFFDGGRFRAAVPCLPFGEGHLLFSPVGFKGNYHYWKYMFYFPGDVSANGGCGFGCDQSADPFVGDAGGVPPEEYFWSEHQRKVLSVDSLSNFISPNARHLRFMSPISFPFESRG